MTPDFCRSRRRARRLDHARPAPPSDLVRGAGSLHAREGAPVASVDELLRTSLARGLELLAHRAGSSDLSLRRRVQPQPDHIVSASSLIVFAMIGIYLRSLPWALLAMIPNAIALAAAVRRHGALGNPPELRKRDRGAHRDRDRRRRHDPLPHGLRPRAALGHGAGPSAARRDLGRRRSGDRDGDRPRARFLLDDDLADAERRRHGAALRRRHHRQQPSRICSYFPRSSRPWHIGGASEAHPDAMDESPPARPSSRRILSSEPRDRLPRGRGARAGRGRGVPVVCATAAPLPALPERGGRLRSGAARGAARSSPATRSWASRSTVAPSRGLGKRSLALAPGAVCPPSSPFAAPERPPIVRSPSFR